MLRFAICGALALGLSGCAVLTLEDLESVDGPSVTCATNASGGCRFNLAPLRVLDTPVTIPRRPYKFFPTAEQLRFVDARGRQWVAPPRTLTDGASIPPIFTAIVGDPTSETFINAAAVHDAYCGVGNETGANFQNGRWEDVHIMFYDGLVAGGTPDLTAKLMFAAVWLGGPRWNTTFDLSHVPVDRKQQAMRETKAFIESTDPEFKKLLRYLRKWQNLMLAEFPSPRAEGYGYDQSASGGGIGLDGIGDTGGGTGGNGGGGLTGTGGGIDSPGSDV
ncbi:DUF1353 domain-containing protein [Thalassococcus lentus]|uniref:DUF1353 domain-containing protein n=1 Tax=Thalassococcus lentus TaxID=1210524 RepID=A0ABT4XVD6_9RHOB|nr:DUF1353 domain-containing protein [Thalassococcus lentus]MDA7425773.1 DUF1353 domain-containing protein [Thalassococcus lentus]